ncbi:STAS domain-containing protein [Kiloniella sp. b19]|uniref:STAS domain-containing protein n=1 Tax=Kiloniella sp. GXU_MW_B19 TaxID=3141326 RepID=UPI0031D45B8B
MQNSNTTYNQKETFYHITGYFDAETVAVLEDDLANLIEKETGRLILDLSTVDFIDSSGIGSIVFLFKRLRVQNRELVLKGVHGQPARLLKSLKVDQAIHTEFSEDTEALQ